VRSNCDIYAGQIPGDIHDQKPIDAGRLDATFAWPNGIEVDELGNLWVGDYANWSLRFIPPAGPTSTLPCYDSTKLDRRNDRQSAAWSYPEPIGVLDQESIAVRSVNGHDVFALRSDGTSTRRWRFGGRRSVVGVRRGPGGHLYALVNEDHTGSILRLDPGGRSEPIAKLECRYAALDADHDALWLRHESGVTTWTLDAGLEELVIQQGDWGLNSEIVGLAVDAQKRLYVVEIHSGVLRIDQDGSVNHVVEMQRGGNGIAIGPCGRLFVSSGELGVILRSTYPVSDPE
jgi:ligand-binding sensor domain-containing protein